MKAPILLKTIVDICFFFLLIGFLGALIIYGLAVFSPDDPIIPIELNGTTVTSLTLTSGILITSELLLAGLIVYTIHTLRKLIRTFFSGKLFTRFQITSLQKIGNLIIFTTLVQALLGVLANYLIINQTERVGIGLDLSFSSFWFVLAIGFFLVYLSKVFENARIMKEENELTV